MADPRTHALRMVELLDLRVGGGVLLHEPTADDILAWLDKHKRQIAQPWEPNGDEWRRFSLCWNDEISEFGEPVVLVWPEDIGGQRRWSVWLAWEEHDHEYAAAEDAKAAADAALVAAGWALAGGAR